jgi:pyruvate/2-oxoglutarate dehydrogenase complex dihydrolipoamide acyltransferase (E2) component
VKVPLTLPELGALRVTFSLWYVRCGESVVEGERIAEVLIPGATYDIHAPVTGTLVEQLAFPNDALIPGQELGWIEGERPA